RAGIRRGSVSHRRTHQAHARARRRAAFGRDLPGLHVRIRARLLLSRRRAGCAENLAARKTAAAASAQHGIARRRTDPGVDLRDADRLVSDRPHAGTNVRAGARADFSGRGRRCAGVRAGRSGKLRLARRPRGRRRDRGEAERIAVNTLRVLSAGPGVTLQDGGRHGFLRFGVTAAGPMDPLAFATANAAAGAENHATAIEVSLGGVELAADAAVSLAIAGGAFRVALGGRPLPSTAVAAVATLEPGQKLAVRPGDAGVWCYIAVAGRIEVPQMLGST